MSWTTLGNTGIYSTTLPWTSKRLLQSTHWQIQRVSLWPLDPQRLAHPTDAAASAHPLFQGAAVTCHHHHFKPWGEVILPFWVGTATSNHYRQNQLVTNISLSWYHLTLFLWPLSLSTHESMILLPVPSHWHHLLFNNKTNSILLKNSIDHYLFGRYQPWTRSIPSMVNQYFQA